MLCSKRDSLSIANGTAAVYGNAAFSESVNNVREARELDVQH